MGGRHVPPSPSSDCCIGLPGYDDAGVGGEVKRPALVGGDPGGVDDGPVEPLGGTDQGRCSSVDNPPWLGSCRNSGPGIIQAGLQVNDGQPGVLYGLGPVLDDVGLGSGGRVGFATLGPICNHHGDLELLPSEATCRPRCTVAAKGLEPGEPLFELLK